MGSSGSKTKKEKPEAKKSNVKHTSNKSPSKEGAGKLQTEKISQYKVMMPCKGDEDEFFTYSDPNDSSMMSLEGVVKFFQDLGIDGESVDSLYLLYIMDTEELQSIKMSEYQGLLEKAKVSSVKDARPFVIKQIEEIKNSDDHFKKFMSFIFRSANVDNPMSKYITADQCVPILELVSQSHKCLRNSALCK
jgi:hypothetical protein